MHHDMLRAVWALSALALMTSPIAGPAGEHRIGGGAHYWRTVEDLDDSDFDIDEDGLAYLVSYQYVAGSFLKLEVDLEIFPDGVGGIQETTYAPQALLLLGSGLYGGIGIGTFYVDNEFADDPFYVLRAGIDLELLPNLRLDINANYHFTDFESIETVDDDIDTDTITLGAMLRLVL
jgi:opacity protein-like surface antigen